MRRTPHPDPLPGGERVESRILPGGERVESRIPPGGERVKGRILFGGERVKSRILPRREKGVFSGRHKRKEIRRKNWHCF